MSIPSTPPAQTVLVTGGTGGIGFITARELAHPGRRVVIVGRNPQKAATAVEAIQSQTRNPDVHALIADLSSLAAVRALADEFQRRFDRLDVLVNNAGAFFAQRQVSIDGLEMTFALNHMAYFLLTHRLLDLLKASPAGRIVNVSSAAHATAHLNFDDLQNERRYFGWNVYSQSKLANLYFTYSLARRLPPNGPTVNALHPGFVATNFGHTPGLIGQFIRLSQFAAIPPEQGARTSIHLASSPEVAGITGRYFSNSKAVRSSPVSYNENAAERLWQISADLAGVPAD